MPGRDPRVDRYIDALEPWMRETATRVRELIHEADRGIDEVIKRTDRPYFVCAGNVCALQATRDHLNVFIYDPDVADPAHLINQGNGNATARAIQLYELDVIDPGAFRSLVTEICDRNRAGGWRRLRSA